MALLLPIFGVSKHLFAFVLETSSLSADLASGAACALLPVSLDHPSPLQLRELGVNACECHTFLLAAAVFCSTRCPKDSWLL